MKKVLKLRWFICALWIIAAVLLTVCQPDVNAILRQRGQGDVTDDSTSKIAESILSKISAAKGKNGIIVFYDSNKLSEADMKQIEKGMSNLQTYKNELGISNIIDPFSMPAAKSSLISEDETTLMVSFNLDKQNREVDDIKKELEEKLNDVKVTHYFTGEDFINNEYLKTTQTGVEKSAAITVIFILVILMVMFRSVVTPLISLLAVGLSYLCSMGIAAQLIEKLNFPITSLTQMLLVLILFGIGTDYNILLFNRFKEELGHNNSVDEAIAATYKTAGKTVFFSILTVFVAFLSLGLAKYGIYQSGTVVAIGTAILLLEIMTFTPFIMKTFGKKLFWPSKKAVGHKESKLWEKVSSMSVKHPVISTLVILAVVLPVIYFNTQKISYDSLKELGDSSPASVGFNIVAEHFSRGQALPTTVVIESDKAMDNNEALSVVDQLTEQLKAISGVKKVSSVTQPEAKQISQFYLSDQTKTVTDGISQTKDGVDKINTGLDTISSNLTTPDFSSVNELVKGTGSLYTGLGSITGGLTQIDSGIEKGADGAAAISDGIGKLKDGLATVSNNTNQLSTGLATLQGGYSQLRDGYKQIEQKLPDISKGIGGMNQLISGLGQKYPEQLEADEQYLTLKQTGTSLELGLTQLNSGMQELGKNYDNLNAGFKQANDGLIQLAAAQKQMVTGLEELQKGAAALSDGLKKGSSGQKAVIANMKLMQSGLQKINNGQQQLNSGLSKLSGGMGQLKDGIDKSSNGLSDISDGLGKTNKYLAQLSSAKTFFVPREALESSDFNKAMDNFMSSDRKITKLIVILNDDPYSMAAVNTVGKINETVSGTLKGSELSDCSYGTSGPTSRTNDMNKILTSDLNRTKVIILVCVFLILILIIRSFWIPLYIIVSLIGAYYIGMTATGMVVANILKLDGMSSFVPFFAFIIIISLGVDYSIFLMMRYKEYPELSPKEAIVSAAKHIGGVVISAGIILGGTFATLIPSGLALLIELAVAVIFGIAALCLIFLPVFLPALITLPDFLKKHTLNKSITNRKESM